MPLKRPGGNPSHLLRQAERLLKIRPRSIVELRARLFHKGFSTQEVEGLLDTLQKKNLLNDQAFAAWWIRQRIKLRPTGEFRLRQELRLKGVDQGVIDRVLSESGISSIDSKLASQALEPRLERLSKLSSLDRKRKIDSFLSRRGFSRRTIYKIIRELEDK